MDEIDHVIWLIEAFMSAVGVMYTTELEEGQDKYGSDFTNYNAITLKHMSYNFGSGTCTPFHDGVIHHYFYHYLVVECIVGCVLHCPCCLQLRV